MSPSRSDARLRLRPISLRDAAAFIERHHRHHEPPRGWRFGVGVECGGDLVGVAVAGRPGARVLDDGRTLEVTRCCTDGSRNAASMLYGAIRRAGKALGYERFVTYLLASESGVSLRAAGWRPEAEVKGRSWNTPSRPRGAGLTAERSGQAQAALALDLPVDRHPTVDKVRWVAP